MKEVTRSLASAGLVIWGVVAHAFAVVVNLASVIDGRGLGAARELPVNITIHGGCVPK